MSANTNDRQARNGRGERPSLRIEDPLPALAPSTMWSSMAQVAAVGLFVLALIAALNLARPVLLPAVSAFVVTMMLGPLSARAEKAGLPSIATAIILWLLVIGVIYGLIALLAAPVLDWIGKGPEIARNIREKLHVFDAPMQSLRDIRNALLPESNKEGMGVDLVTFVSPIVTVVAPGIGQVFIFFGTLFFMLLGRNRIRRDLVGFFDLREAKLRTLKIMNDIEHNLTDYLSVMTVINLCVGVAGFAVAWTVGLPSPVAWGVLGFILNYIPYIGALMMEVALFLVGLVTFPTLTHALIAPALYLGFTTLEGHFITPSVIGHRLTLTPLTVFMSLVFWTWLWGPVGAFLAVPLLIMGLVALGHLFPRDEPALPD